MIDLKREAVIDEEIFTYLSRAEKFNYDYNFSNIFLTGATGFIGSFLLSELLKKTTADIYCLVRASNTVAAKKRISDTFKNYKLDEFLEEGYFKRVIPVVGDLEKKYCGVNENCFNELSRKIDVIYHCGAKVHFMLPYYTLKAANVFGTHELVRLAAVKRVKPIHYLSTLYIYNWFAQDRSKDSGLLSEETDIDEFLPPNMGYAQSKWVAEKMLFIARAKGMPVTIYRPLRILGHSRTGACQDRDFAWKFMKGCLQLGYMFESEADVGFFPVDYLCTVIHYLSKKREATGKIYHLVNPNTMTINEFMKHIMSYGYSLKTVSFDEFGTLVREKLNNGKIDKKMELFGLLPVLIAHLNLFDRSGQNDFGNLEFSVTNTENDLKEASIKAPEMNYDLIKNYLDYFVEQGILEPPINS